MLVGFYQLPNKLANVSGVRTPTRDKEKFLCKSSARRSTLLTNHKVYMSAMKFYVIFEKVILWFKFINSKLTFSFSGLTELIEYI